MLMSATISLLSYFSALVYNERRKNVLRIILKRAKSIGWRNLKGKNDDDYYATHVTFKTLWKSRRCVNVEKSFSEEIAVAFIRAEDELCDFWNFRNARAQNQCKILSALTLIKHKILHLQNYRSWSFLRAKALACSVIHAFCRTRVTAANYWLSLHYKIFVMRASLIIHHLSLEQYFIRRWWRSMSVS